MKKITIGVLAFLVIGIGLSCISEKGNQQDEFTIEGKIPGLSNGATVVVSYKDGDDFRADSAIVNNGGFTIKGKIEIPSRAVLQLKSGEIMNPLPPGAFAMRPDQVDNQIFFLDKGTTKVTGDKNVESSKISGGKAQTEYLSLQSRLRSLNENVNALVEKLRPLFNSNDKAGIKEMSDKISDLRTKISEEGKRFVKENPGSYVSLDLVDSYIEKDPSYDPLYTGLSDQLKNTAVGKKWASHVASSDKTSPGMPAIDFAQNNTKGSPIALNSFKGKFVLIDFWASWCKPCREETPNIAKAYHQYKDKNFEVMSISLDDKKEPWLAAIQKDGMSWINLSDLKGWKNDVAVAYNIKAIPQNFLVDPSGKIVAKNLHGEELFKKLDELLNKFGSTNSGGRAKPF